ncbi:MAG: adenosine deaminase [Halobacteriaceae archaeon]
MSTATRIVLGTVAAAATLSLALVVQLAVTA